MIASKIAAALFLLTAAEPASAFIPAGKCAVVVASRATLPEVFAYMRENQRLPFTQVFAARNGWYAISVGLTDDEGSADALAWRKGRSEIPADSYCSTGEAYTREVWSARVAAPGFASTDSSADFDARPLVREEKRFLQASLALKGYYNGLLDGSWGQGSQTALESWTRSEFQAEPTNALAALAAVIALGELADGGWRPVWFANYRVTAYLPETRMVLNGESEGYVGFRDSLTEVRFSLGHATFEGSATLHADRLADHRLSTAPYVLRNNDLWITSVDRHDQSGSLRR